MQTAVVAAASTAMMPRRGLLTMEEINKQRKLYKPPAAKDLVALVKPIEVDGHIAVCDGGMQELGHPRVFLNLNKPGAHACSYCGQPFVMKSHGSDHH
jgi:uncharacterized Zn-finger protein